jgi:hypothetical protein
VTDPARQRRKTFCLSFLLAQSRAQQQKRCQDCSGPFKSGRQAPRASHSSFLFSLLRPMSISSFHSAQPDRQRKDCKRNANDSSLPSECAAQVSESFEVRRISLRSRFESPLSSHELGESFPMENVKSKNAQLNQTWLLGSPRNYFSSFRAHF